jgi:hypothetical protein
MQGGQIGRDDDGGHDGDQDRADPEQHGAG